MQIRARKSLRLRRTRTDLPTKPVVYPVGSFIETEAGYFYISGSAKRFRFLSKRVLDSWAPHRVIETTEAAVKNYRIAAKMGFRNGSLIHNIADGKIYLVEASKKRHITSPDVLERLGASRNDVVSVSLAEINLHETGEELN